MDKGSETLNAFAKNALAIIQFNYLRRRGMRIKSLISVLSIRLSTAR